MRYDNASPWSKKNARWVLKHCTSRLCKRRGDGCDPPVAQAVKRRQENAAKRMPPSGQKVGFSTFKHFFRRATSSIFSYNSSMLKSQNDYMKQSKNISVQQLLGIFGCVGSISSPPVSTPALSQLYFFISVKIFHFGRGSLISQPDPLCRKHTNMVTS